MTKQEVAELIEGFLNGTCGEWDWDDFISLKHEDPEIEEISVRCSKIANEFPSLQEKHYCSQEGETALKQLAQSLR